MEKIKILLAEDDLFLRDIYNETLTDAGFLVTLAVDGEEALEKLQQGGWDLVLLDDLMPKKSGVEVMEQIDQKKRKNLAKKIIFLTNIDNAADLVQFSALADGHLTKSALTPAQLIDKVKNFLIN